MKKLTEMRKVKGKRNLIPDWNKLCFYKVVVVAKVVIVVVGIFLVYTRFFIWYILL